MEPRNFSSGASGSAPAPLVSPSVGYPTAGNPGAGTPATKPGAYWYHQVGEELRALIAGAGLTPSDSNLSQVYQAVQAMIAAAIVQDYKASVRAATTANIAGLGGSAPNTLDGVTLAANDRILVKDQSTGSQNGLYYVATLGTGANGTWTRVTDADGAGELTAGAVVLVEEGSTYADTQWMLTTNGTITIGTTALVFERKDAGAAQTGFTNITKFTSSGTWTIPAGITKAKVTVIGGGGSGVASASGGGGGGGAIKYLSGLTPGNTIAVTVGAGATAGAGAAGGTSSVASGTQTISTVSATGGGGGGSPFGSAAGGVGSGGDINAGGDSTPIGTSLGYQKGGMSAFGFGGGGGGTYNGGGGADGTGYGGGGGAGGGNGAPGVIVFEY